MRGILLGGLVEHTGLTFCFSCALGSGRKIIHEVLGNFFHFPESEHWALSHLCLTEDQEYWGFLDPYQQRLSLTFHTFS